MEIIISDEKVNLKRQREFDLAKVIAIVFMVLIHVWEEISCIDYFNTKPTGFWHNLLQFGAAPLAAPVFMFAMGIGICYSNHRTPKEFAKRGRQLLVIAYVLNFFRGAIYEILSLLIFGSWDFDHFMYLLFNGDILQFAALSFLLVALLKKLEMPVLAMGALAVIMQIVGSVLAACCPTSGYINYITGLFYFNENCYFPLLQWFIYPVAGIIFAKYLRHITDKDKLYQYLLGISAVLLGGFCGGLVLIGFDLRNFYTLAHDLYYNQQFLYFLFTVLVIVLEVSILYFISKRITSEAVNKVITYVSNKLNQIYIIQWLIVGGFESIALYFIGLDPLGAMPSILLGFAIMIVTYFISKLYDRIKIKKKLKA